jgi:hypothetical protein
MPHFRVRYKVGSGPPEAVEDSIIVEAAMFKTVGNFVDFYPDAVRNVGGGFNAKGGVIFRVSQDVLADVQQLPIAGSPSGS